VGTVLADGGTDIGVTLATIDPAKVQAARNSIPSLQHGRRFMHAAIPMPHPTTCN